MKIEKLSLNKESAIALREFAEAMPIAIENIIDSTTKLVQTYQSVADTVGPHDQAFYDMIMLIKNAQVNSIDAIKELPLKLNETADKIDIYLALNPELKKG